MALGIKSFFARIFGKKKEDVISEPLEIAPQKSGKEILVGQIKDNVGAIDDFFDEVIKSHKVRGAKWVKEERALYDIYKKMIRAFKVANNYSNRGMKSEEEYLEFKRVIDDLLDAKNENVMKIDSGLKDRIDDLVIAFRYTSHELSKNMKSGKPIHGLSIIKEDLKFFEYVVRFKKITDSMRNSINLLRD